MKKYCYVNGKIVDSHKNGVPFSDLGFLRGYAVFDTLRVYNGSLVFFAEHFARLRRSAEKIGMKMPVSGEIVKKEILNLLTKNKEKNVAVKIMLTGGSSVGLNVQKPNLYILLIGLPVFPKDILKKGAKLITHEYERRIPEAKTTDYLEAVKIDPIRRKKNAIEVLYHHGGNISECTTSNFFLVKDGKVITTDKKIILGITRQKILELARKIKEIGFENVIERPIQMNEIHTADEAFITAANKEIIPIVKIDQMVIGNGKVGEITKKLIAAYSELVENVSKTK